MWSINITKQRKEERKKDLKQIAIKLSAAANYARNLIYLRRKGDEAVAKLGPNPIDELLAHAIFEKSGILGSIIQELHFQMDSLYAYDLRVKQDVAEENRAMQGIVATVNKALKEVTATANREKIDPASSGESQATIDEVRSKYGTLDS